MSRILARIVPAAAAALVLGSASAVIAAPVTHPTRSAYQERMIERAPAYDLYSGSDSFGVVPRDFYDRAKGGRQRQQLRSVAVAGLRYRARCGRVAAGNGNGMF